MSKVALGLIILLKLEPDVCVWKVRWVIFACLINSSELSLSWLKTALIFFLSCLLWVEKRLLRSVWQSFKHCLAFVIMSMLSTAVDYGDLLSFFDRFFLICDSWRTLLTTSLKNLFCYCLKVILGLLDLGDDTYVALCGLEAVLNCSCSTVSIKLIIAWGWGD